MGDVVTALSRAVQEEGHDVTVILPKYDCINYSLVKNMGEEQSFHWGGSNVRVWRATVEDLDVRSDCSFGCLLPAVKPFMRSLIR